MFRDALGGDPYPDCLDCVVHLRLEGWLVLLSICFDERGFAFEASHDPVCRDDASVGKVLHAAVGRHGEGIVGF